MKDTTNDQYQRFSLGLNEHKVKPIAGRYALLFLCLASVNFSVFANTVDNELLIKDKVLTLSAAVALANINDPWLGKSESIERSILNKAQAAGALPDPLMSFQLANLPTNGFDFNQEAMTQMKVGITQVLPRGDTLAINQRYQNALSLQHPLYRLNRKAQTTLNVTSTWLDAFRAQASVNLIQNNKALFEQLGEIVQASYASLAGGANQQDIIRAELELTKIEDRIVQLIANEESAKAQLQQWMQNDLASQHQAMTLQANYVLPKTLYALPAFSPTLTKALEHNDYSMLASLVAQHPSVKVVDQAVLASESAIDLARQQYKPQWQLNASYGYREDDALGLSRPDFLSIGASVSLPLFSKLRPDSEVSMAVNQSQALITEKRIVMRDLMGKLMTVVATYKKQIERRKLYTSLVIPQTRQQAESSLNAYTNDIGDFTEVVRDRIAELDAKLTLITIETDLRKNAALVEYLLTTTSSSVKDTAHAN